VRKILLKFERWRPIQNSGDGDARGGNLATAICIASTGFLVALAGAARSKSRKKRQSIHGMLDRSRPCAQRRSC
jgi:hypothetical protein